MSLGLFGKMTKKTDRLKRFDFCLSKRKNNDFDKNNL